MKTIKHLQITCLLMLMSTLGVFAQTDYSVQIAAFKQSYKEKSGAPIKPHLSSEIGFELVPKDALTPEVMDQLLAQIFDMPVISIDVKEVKENEVVLMYDFGDHQELGKRESSILFDESGKITKIELIDNLIKLSAERRSDDANRAKPIPDELADKYPSKRVEIETARGYKVSGDLYEIGKDKPVILLCHQAGYNKYEYIDIAPKLNAMGFNCLAVDLTGGDDVGETKNETIISRGEVENRDINVRLSYTEDEVASSIDYLYKRYNQDITVWGSSYSATIVIYEAQKNDRVKASLSFSAFNHFSKARPKLQDVLPKIDKPMFMTSARSEASIIEGILENIQLKKGQYHFKPEGRGLHGSRALWNGQDDAAEYWVAVKQFLNEVYGK